MKLTVLLEIKTFEVSSESSADKMAHWIRSYLLCFTAIVIHGRSSPLWHEFQQRFATFYLQLTTHMPKYFYANHCTHLANDSITFRCISLAWKVAKRTILSTWHNKRLSHFSLDFKAQLADLYCQFSMAVMANLFLNNFVHFCNRWSSLNCILHPQEVVKMTILSIFTVSFENS